MYLGVINGLRTRPDLCVRKTSEVVSVPDSGSRTAVESGTETTSEVDLAKLQVDYNEGNRGYYGEPELLGI